MGTGGPQTIPFPLSSFPGATFQEAAGRIINAYSEPLGDPQQQNYGAPKDGVVWRRAPGLTQFSITGQTGYRGGLAAANTSYEAFSGQALTITQAGVSAPIGSGSLPGTNPISIASNQNASGPDVVAVDPVTGAFVLQSTILPAQVTATLSGTTVASDTVSITFTNPQETLAGAAWPVTAATAALTGGATPIQVATALVTAINTNPILNAAFVSATNVGGTSATVTILQTGIIGNQTTVTFGKTGTGTQACVFNPVNPSGPGGIMTGGAGVPGTFVPGGSPQSYNGQGNLPAVNSVSFQDGYFFFTVADGRVFASGINSLTQNAITFGRVQAKADVTLLRGIPYQGYMFFFTTGSCEVWSDQANAAPAFPYGRNAIIPTSLLQGSCIAGFETGFDNLLWVAADYGVYNMPQGALGPVKVSPPDLDRLIETQFKAGDTLQASVYMFAGKKVWVISSSKWTWTFQLNSQKWFERGSLQPNGALGRWRGTGGHLAFGKWLMGDQQSTSMLFLDDTNPYDTVTQNPTTFATIANRMLMRLESGVVDKFPIRSRVARADFHFVQGVGMPVAAIPLQVTGAAAAGGAGSAVRLTVLSTLGANTGDPGTVSGVQGTVEANGTWTLTVVDATHIDLQGTVFVHPYTNGGTVTDLQIPADLANPTVAVSWSDDGGNSYRPPVIRGLGQLSVVKIGRVAVKNAGLTGQIGRRWRLDIAAPVYTAFLKGSQSDAPTIPN